jgi:CheY-like chemotaxis protein
MKTDSNKILIVDDNKNILDVLSQVIVRLDYEAVCADNGDRGLELFLQGPCDIVLTDYEMPGMDGITLAHYIKEISPQTTVVLMTGHDRAEFMQQLETAKVDLVLSKPFDVLEIMFILQPQQAPIEAQRPAGPLSPKVHNNPKGYTV